MTRGRPAKPRPDARRVIAFLQLLDDGQLVKTAAAAAGLSAVEAREVRKRHPLQPTYAEDACYPQECQTADTSS
jgi:hypothetical protein